MRRLLLPLAAAVMLAGSVAAPAGAEAAKGPQRGLWTCENGGTVPFATFELFKGNKYAANGDTEKGKYVYKAGQKKLKFKSGIWEGVFYGEYQDKVVTLYSVESTGPEAVCTRLEDTEERALR